MISSYIDNAYLWLFSSTVKEKVEKFIFFIASFSFIVHFIFILLVKVGIIPFYLYEENLREIPSLISSIYTPFSIILLYEIYLLIYYLPRSLSVYLGKQYEIIVLIFIRSVFDQLGKFPENNIYFSYSTISYLLLTFGVLFILLLLLFCYYKLSGVSKNNIADCDNNRKMQLYLLMKKMMAIGLLGVFVFLFVRSLIQLFNFPSLTFSNVMGVFKSINLVFFDVFFTSLILAEVLLLIFMYNVSDNFNKVFRNSGFIISTILLKLSFRTSGVTNMIVILIAVSFGVCILGLYRLFEEKLKNKIE